MTSLKPVYLLADSIPLFTKHKQNYALVEIKSLFKKDELTAVYIGASNNDKTEYYEMFVQAMSNIGITNCNMINSQFDNQGQSNLQSADIILLAGGEVKLGWEVISQTEMATLIKQKYDDGAVLIGTSAGARHLSNQILVDADTSEVKVVNALGIVPFPVTTGDTLDEIKAMLSLSDANNKGYHIPYGGLMVYWPNEDLQFRLKATKAIAHHRGKFEESLQEFV